MTDSEWIKQERDHEYEMYREKMRSEGNARAHRTERIQAVAWAVGAVLVVAILSGVVAFWQESSSDRKQELQMACLENGGTWAGLNGGGKVCVEVAPK